MIRVCPNESPECPWYDREEGCHSSVHHTFYPRSDYRTGIAREFRNLPENKELLCRDLHDEIHATEWPPLKPSMQAMREALGYLMITAE